MAWKVIDSSGRAKGSISAYGWNVLSASGSGLTLVDHGALSGLTDDDHTQYLLADGTRPLTGNWDAGNFDIRMDEAKVETGIVIEKTAGLGIKVDLTTPTFPWRSMVGSFSVRAAGGTDPALAVYQGNIRQFQFGVNEEVWLEFPIPHDYVPSTDLVIDINWSHNVTVVTGGSVTWGMDVTYAKGNNQGAFPATVNPTVTQNASTTQYQLMTASVTIATSSPSASQLDADNLEPGGLILMRLYLSANNITSSGAVPEPFGHNSHLMYQSTNIGTKNNTNPFYS